MSFVLFGRPGWYWLVLALPRTFKLRIGRVAFLAHFHCISSTFPMHFQCPSILVFQLDPVAARLKMKLKHFTGLEVLEQSSKTFIV